MTDDYVFDERIFSYVGGEFTLKTYATTVFVARVPVPYPSISGYMGTLELCWDIYVTGFRKVRTVCYGFYTYPTHEGEETKSVSSFALLHDDHPEELDVMIGIRRTFADIANTMLRGTPYQVFTGDRRFKKPLWEKFEKVLYRNFFQNDGNNDGYWRLKDSESETRVRNNLDRIRELLDV